jgi:hypothetical protein
MIQSERHKELTELFCRLCEENGVEVGWMVGCNAADPFERFIGLKFASIYTDADFAIAMHELGHLLVPDKVQWGPRMGRELSAWQRARDMCAENNVTWSPEMFTCEVECLEAWGDEVERRRQEIDDRRRETPGQP